MLFLITKTTRGLVTLSEGNALLASVRTPAKPTVCLRLAGKRTSGPLRRPMGYHVGWQNTFGPLGPDFCRGFEGQS